MDLFFSWYKEMADPAAGETVRNIKTIGKEQFQAFTKECLVERTNPIYNVIRRNKMKLFSTSSQISVSKRKQQVVAVKNDLQLFSRLYISYQTKNGNIEDFFRHDNQACLRHSRKKESST